MRAGAGISRIRNSPLLPCTENGGSIQEGNVLGSGILKKIALLVLLMSSFVNVVADDFELSVTRRAQEQTNWCWAASTQAILSAFGSTLKQCEVVSIALEKGQGYCCRRENEGECNKTFRSAFALRKFGYQTSIVPGQISVARINAELKAGRPVAFQVQKTGHFHEMLIFGISPDDRLIVWEPTEGLSSYGTPSQIERDFGPWTETYLVHTQAGKKVSQSSAPSYSRPSAREQKVQSTFDEIMRELKSLKK